MLAAVGVSLDADDLRRLWQHTEGWAGALRLAALSLRGHPDPGRFVDDFAGDDRAISDYLLSEVMSRASPEEPQLPAADVGRRACSTATSRTRSPAAPTGTAGWPSWRAAARCSRRWTGAATGIRYHALFRELLQAELRSESPELVPELHRRAADVVRRARRRRARRCCTRSRPRLGPRGAAGGRALGRPADPRRDRRARPAGRAAARPQWPWRIPSSRSRWRARCSTAATTRRRRVFWRAAGAAERVPAERRDALRRLAVRARALRRAAARRPRRGARDGPRRSPRDGAARARRGRRRPARARAAAPRHRRAVGRDALDAAGHTSSGPAARRPRPAATGSC